MLALVYELPAKHTSQKLTSLQNCIDQVSRGSKRTCVLGFPSRLEKWAVGGVLFAVTNRPAVSAPWLGKVMGEALPVWRLIQIPLTT